MPVRACRARAGSWRRCRAGGRAHGASGSARAAPSGRRASPTTFPKAGFAGIKWDKWDSKGQDCACPKGRARGRRDLARPRRPPSQSRGRGRWVRGRKRGPRPRGRGGKSTVASACLGSFVPPLHGAIVAQTGRAVHRTLVLTARPRPAAAMAIEPTRCTSPSALLQYPPGRKYSHAKNLTSAAQRGTRMPSRATRL